jgi:hypothetical protein
MHSFLLFFQPLPETVALVEDIVVEYVTDLVSYFLHLSAMCFMFGLLRECKLFTDRKVIFVAILLWIV